MPMRRVPTCITFAISLIFGLFGAPHLSPAQDTRGLKTSRPGTNGQSPPYSARYALIIGINKYQDKDIKDLRYAVNDAHTIRNLLVEQYNYPQENITLLNDVHATREGILTGLSRYLEQDIDENSQLLVYYAGHGHTIGDQNTELGYLLPHDARVGSIQDVFSSGIAMEEIQRAARALRPKHVLFLMDACYGGLAGTRSSTSSVFIRNALDRKARQLITAGSAEEEVIESAKWHHSAFTKVLVDALENQYADGNEDGIISTVELFSFVESRVPYYAASEGGKQTPQYSKLTPDDGTFLFFKDEHALAALQQNEQSLLELDVEVIRRSFTTPLRIAANVDNARVYIDEKEVGYLSDGVFNYDMSPGFYRIELKKDKYGDSVQEIEVMPDTTLTVSFDLDYVFSEVVFNVNPTDAAVYIDDEFIGSGSFSKELPKGRTKFLITKEGYRPEVINANLTLDRTPLDVTLDRIEARLELYTVPSSAMMLLNGDTLGTTPIRVPLAYGTHSVYLQKDGYRDELFLLEVNDSELIRRTEKLRETPEVIARRTYRGHLMRHTKGFLFSSTLALGTFIGHKQLTDLEQDAPDGDEYKQIYTIGRWTALGVSGIAAFDAAARLLRIGKTRYSVILNEQLEKESADQISLHVAPVIELNQAGLAAVLNF